MATPLSQSTQKSLETYFLLWLDVAVNSSEENIHAQQQLRSSINQLTTYDNDAICEQYIHSVPKDDRIVLIVSGQRGQQIVPRIHHLPQLTLIYVYCKNQKYHEQWAKQFYKVRAVTTQLDDLIKAISCDQNQRWLNKIDESFSMSFFSTDASSEGQSTSELDGEFIHSQLLIDCLTRMEPTPTDRDEFIGICKREYQGNDAEMKILHEFETNYTSDDAIWWYTRQSFIYRLLNKALRVKNTDLLYLFRFFIRDLERQLRYNQYTSSSSSSSSIRVYRGQVMSQVEIETLKNRIGQLISINSFLSTSMNRELARFFIATSNISHDVERVFFEIDADPSHHNIKPFSRIDAYSYFRGEEQEVLFTVGSIFQLKSVHCDENGIWVIRVTLSSNDDHQLQSLLTFLKTESKDAQINLISVGDVLLKMGRFNDAEKCYQRCLNEGSSDPIFLARCYESLGKVALRKADLDGSLEWLNKSLEVKRQNSDPNDQCMASNYHSMGIAHRKKNNLDEAMKMFEQALKIWLETRGDNSLEVAKCYADIGTVYQRQYIFSEALDYHQMAFNIRRKNLPQYHPKLGLAHANLATIYRSLKKYEHSLEHANEALDILRKSLPAHHPWVAWTLENIGLVYEEQGKLKESLSCLNKAVHIYQQELPSTHYYITDLQRSIQRVESQLL